MSIIKNRRFSSARKFLLHRLDDSDDESSNIEWELPTRRRFISLTPADLLNSDNSFINKQMKQGEIKIDTAPSTIDETQEKQPISPQKDDTKPTEEITQHNRYSFCNTKNNQLADATIKKIFEEQLKMKEEMQKKYKQFQEYEEIEKMEKKMQQAQDTKIKEENELKEIEAQKQEERKQNLEQLEQQKQIELNEIKQIIAEEFLKRNDELQDKQQQIEQLKQKIEEQITEKNDANAALKHDASENESVIANLKKKVSELQMKEDTEDNKKEISLTESKIETAEMKQDEILKEINDNIELHQTLEDEQKELEENEEDLKQQQQNLEIEKEKEIKEQSKNAFKKFDILRANIMMEAEIGFKHIREKRSLLNIDDMMKRMKLKMKKQFKEQMMRLKMQLNDNKEDSVKLPYTKIDSSFFGEDAGEITLALSPNSEMCACLGTNSIFHVLDIRTGDDLYLGSLKGIISNYDKNVIENETQNVNVEHIEWDKEGMLMALLLTGCKWIGVWNSLTKAFYELSVDECYGIITAFGWSHNKLLFGMNNGDIYIKNMYKEDSELIMIKNKMFDKIDFCRWSLDHNFAIVVNATHIAVANDVGVTVERIVSKQSVMDLKCGYINGKNILSILTEHNLIVHGVNDQMARKLMTFDENFGGIKKHRWCHESIIIAFDGGHLVIINAVSYSNKHVECGKSIKDMDAIYLPNVGYIIAIIDDECIRFLKYIDDISIESQWTVIAVIHYKDCEWLMDGETLENIQLTENGNYSVVVTDKSTMIIYKLMM